VLVRVEVRGGTAVPVGVGDAAGIVEQKTSQPLPGPSVAIFTLF
jgi:hypothetical protein